MNTRTRREKCKTCGEWSNVWERTGTCVDTTTCDMHAAGYDQDELDRDSVLPPRPPQVQRLPVPAPSFEQVDRELGRHRGADSKLYKPLFSEDPEEAAHVARADRIDDELDFAGVTSEELNEARGRRG